jgi:hypothetical protein
MHISSLSDPTRYLGSPNKNASLTTKVLEFDPAFVLQVSLKAERDYPNFVESSIVQKLKSTIDSRRVVTIPNERSSIIQIYGGYQG